MVKIPTIIDYGLIDIPPSIVEYADKIRHENYKTNTPKNFHKHPGNIADSDLLLKSLAEIISIDNHERLDFVFFSACEGAETHTDLLDPEVFQEITYVVPIIIPHDSILTCEDTEIVGQPNHVYCFDHNKPHGLTMKDNEFGCVFIMVAVNRFKNAHDKRDWETGNQQLCEGPEEHLVKRIFIEELDVGPTVTGKMDLMKKIMQRLNGHANPAVIYNWIGKWLDQEDYTKKQPWISMIQQIPRQQQEVWYYFGVFDCVYAGHFSQDHNEGDEDENDQCYQINTFYGSGGFLGDDVMYWMPRINENKPNPPTDIQLLSDIHVPNRLTVVDIEPF